jgi:hypothetical protein
MERKKAALVSTRRASRQAASAPQFSMLAIQKASPAASGKRLRKSK